jgi:Patatin-like phospholipase
MKRIPISSKEAVMGTSVKIENFKEVLSAEHIRVKARRRKAGLSEGKPEKDSIGLALSGGGVRSATYNLGLLQAMNYYDFFPKVDYLSTVSGGGYIGSSVTWFMSRLEKAFPFLTTCKKMDAACVLRWLRSHSSYLTPGQGLGLAALAAAVLRGMFINLLIFFPLFVAAVYCLSTKVDIGISWFKAWTRPDFFPLLFIVGVVLAAGLLVGFFIFALLSVSIRQQDFNQRRSVHMWMGHILAVAVPLIVLGLMPIVYDWLRGTFQIWWQQIMSSLSIAGIIAFLAGWLGRSRSNETHGWVAWLLRIGLLLLMFGMLIWLYHFSIYLHDLEKVTFFDYSLRPGFLVICGVFVSLFTGLLSNVNLVSMHRYYRDRLMETYMPEFSEDNNEVSFRHSDKCYLSDIPQTSAPYHIINTNLVTVGSAEPKYRARGGDNFIFSSEFIGSEATGYVSTNEYEFGKINLATAFAISGAAVDPNTGVTRSRPLAFIMTLLNVRLGYWIRNPKRPRLLPEALCRIFSRPFWHLYMLREMFGWGINEKGCYLHLSDGGHFENLGLYELVRRKCRYIIVADAGADSRWTFGDLARACERIRVDFCAHMEINTMPLHPDKESHLSPQPCILGTINYEDGNKSTVLFIKSTVFPNLPEDIYGYKRANPNFPDQTTADQFFDEAQFEAYRELGYSTGRYIFDKKTMAEIFPDK